MSNIAIIDEKNTAVMTAVDIDFLVQRANLINSVIGQVMKENVHYGIIPGCGDRKVLYKAGAEALSQLFQLFPEYSVERKDLDKGHREYEVTCTLKNLKGDRLGSGVGLCSTMESKFRYRNSKKACPSCGHETIIKGKAEYGGGWLCYAKAGGCGAKFEDGDSVIENQLVGKIENPDLADTYNTVFKIATKRAYVHAVIATTAVSNIFLQDPSAFVESTYDDDGDEKVKADKKNSGKKVWTEEERISTIVDKMPYYKHRVHIVNTMKKILKADYQFPKPDDDGGWVQLYEFLLKYKKAQTSKVEETPDKKITDADYSVEQ